MDLRTHRGSTASAVGHFAVVYPYTKQGLCAIGFVGSNGQLKRMAQAMKEKGTVEISYEDRCEDYKRNNYVPLRRRKRLNICFPRGDISIKWQDLGEGNSIVIAMHELCFSSSEDETERVVIFPNGENEEDNIGSYLSEHFVLPEQWKEEYTSPEYFKKNILPLRVITNPEFKRYSDMVAYSFKLSSKKMEEAISNNLKAGRLRIEGGHPEGYFNPQETEQKIEYVKNNLRPIVKTLETSPPYHDANSADEVFDPAFLGLEDKHLLLMQARGAQSILNRFRQGKKKYAIIGGEQGIGKSMMALMVVKALAKNKDKFRVLLSAPAEILPKWRDEEISSIPGAKITEVKTSEEALRYVREEQKDGIEFVLVSNDRVKYGPIKETGAVVWKRVTVNHDGKKYLPRSSGQVYDSSLRAWHCSTCYLPLVPGNKTDHVSTFPKTALWNVMAGKTPGESEEVVGQTQEGWALKKVRRETVNWKFTKRKCPYCGAPLTRPVSPCEPGGPKKNRWEIAKIFQKRLKADLVMIDEVHQNAGISLRANAYGRLCHAGKRVLGVTATTTNGKVSSLRNLKKPLDPQEFKNINHFHSSDLAFSKDFGSVETVQTIGRDEEGRITMTEVAGLSPLAVVNFLQPCCVFVDMPDMGIPLPEIKHHPAFIDMDEEHREAYNEFHGKLSSFSYRVGPGALIPALLNYADTQQEVAVNIKWKHRGSEETEERSLTSRALPGYSTKERWIAEKVVEEMQEGRPCFIFTNFTGKYAINERLQEVLKGYGIDAVILDTSVPASERTTWLQNNAGKVKVVIGNMALVGHGLDLIQWPTAIFAQLTYQTNLLRHSQHRSWRFGQEREVRVFYPVVNGTQQVSQFNKVMKQRGAALAAEGRIDHSELKKWTDNEDHHGLADLLSLILSEEEKEDRSSTWQKLSAIDSERVEQVSEGHYREALNKAIKIQQEEVIRKCEGKPLLEVEEIVEVAPVALRPIGEKIKISKKRSLESNQLCFIF